MGNKKFKKVKVTFLGDAESRDHKGAIEMEASRGDVRELVEPSADFWISRGIAIEGEVKLDDDNDQETSEGLEKAAEALEKSNERLKAAEALEKSNERLKAAKAVPVTSEGAEKEIDLATKHQAKKQQEYDALIAAAEKA